MAETATGTIHLERDPELLRLTFDEVHDEVTLTFVSEDGTETSMTITREDAGLLSERISAGCQKMVE